MSSLSAGVSGDPLGGDRFLCRENSVYLLSGRRPDALANNELSEVAGFRPHDAIREGRWIATGPRLAGPGAMSRRPAGGQNEVEMEGQFGRDL